MSASAAPISSARFAAALKSLSLDTLYAKTAEIHNSVTHLEASNQDLQEYAAEDSECADAIWENMATIGRMHERIDLLKKEVESRGFVWDEERNYTLNVPVELNGVREEVNGDIVELQRERAQRGIGNGDGTSVGADQGDRGGRLGDGELAGGLQDRLNDHADDEDGVHL